MANVEDYREAAGCIILLIDGKENDRILLLRRSENETSQQEVRIIRTLKPHVDDSMQKVYHGFIARIIGNKVKVLLSDEHDEYRWMTVKEALSMDAPLSHHADFLFRQWKPCYRQEKIAK